MIITSREAAMFLGVSVPTIAGYIKQGVLTNVFPVSSLIKKKNVHIRIRSEEIESRFKRKFDVLGLIGSMGMMPITRAAKYIGVSSSYLKNNASILELNIKTIVTNSKKTNKKIIRTFVELKRKEEVVESVLPKTHLRKRFTRLVR